MNKQIILCCQEVDSAHQGKAKRKQTNKQTKKTSIETLENPSVIDTGVLLHTCR